MKFSNLFLMLLDSILGQQTLPDRAKLGFWENIFAGKGE
jgi:hypothetical protein